MAHKELVAKGALRYGTRMLQAGDPLVLDGPKARLYQALGLVDEPTAEYVPVDAERATINDTHRPARKTDAAPKAAKKRGGRKSKAKASK